MTAVILDASALLAMLKEEKGGDKVAGVIADAQISAVNYAEVVCHFIDAGMPADAVDAMLGPLPLNIVPADAELARRQDDYDPSLLTRDCPSATGSARLWHCGRQR